MKTIIGMLITTLLAGLTGGLFIESQWHFLDKGFEASGSGKPKEGLPPSAGAMHVDYYAPDGTFIASYKGERLYYKPILTTNGTKIILEPGAVYEIVDQKLKVGGYRPMPVRIDK